MAFGAAYGDAPVHASMSVAEQRGTLQDVIAFATSGAEPMSETVVFTFGAPLAAMRSRRVKPKSHADGSVHGLSPYAPDRPTKPHQRRAAARPRPAAEAARPRLGEPPRWSG